jgi:antitoxin ParD1/3/4
MPSKHTLNVVLTPQLRGFAMQLVASGRYRTLSEVMRASLRLLEVEHANASARRAKLEGKTSGGGRSSNSAITAKSEASKLSPRTSQ